MNQDEFLSKLFNLYAPSFNKGNGQAWIEAYKQVLKPNIDYDKLYDFMLCNYAGAAAPSPAFLIKNATYISNKSASDDFVVITLIAFKKGHGEMDFAITDNDYVGNAEYFKKRGFTIMRCRDNNECYCCNYNHICEKAKEVKGRYGS